MVKKDKNPNWFVFGVKNQTELLDDFNHHLWILGISMARVGWTLDLLKDFCSCITGTKISHIANHVILI